MEYIISNYSDNEETDDTEIETDVFSLLTKDIKDFFLKKDNMTSYVLTKYNTFEIDGINCFVYIQKVNKKYRYYLSAKNIKYHFITATRMSDSIYLYISSDFKEISELLQHIQNVKTNYTFFDNYLCSIEQRKKIIKLNRSLHFFTKEETECSICYEPTKQKTLCNHPICLHCRESCILNSKKKCPICRQTKLKYYPYPYDLF
jgi:hypothetical protein